MSHLLDGFLASLARHPAAQLLRACSRPALGAACGQLVAVPDERRESCAREVREALSRLATDRGIPYVLHVLHVHVGGGAARAADPGTRAG